MDLDDSEESSSTLSISESFSTPAVESSDPPVPPTVSSEEAPTVHPSVSKSAPNSLDNPYNPPIAEAEKASSAHVDMANQQAPTISNLTGPFDITYTGMRAKKRTMMKAAGKMLPSGRAVFYKKSTTSQRC